MNTQKTELEQLVEEVDAQTSKERRALTWASASPAGPALSLFLRPVGKRKTWPSFARSKEWPAGQVRGG